MEVARKSVIQLQLLDLNLQHPSSKTIHTSKLKTRERTYALKKFKIISKQALKPQRMSGLLLNSLKRLCRVRGCLPLLRTLRLCRFFRRWAQSPKRPCRSTEIILSSKNCYSNSVLSAGTILIKLPTKKRLKRRRRCKTTQ